MVGDESNVPGAEDGGSVCAGVMSAACVRGVPGIARSLSSEGPADVACAGGGIG